MGQGAPPHTRLSVTLEPCLSQGQWRRLTAASPGAGLGPPFPPRYGQTGLASRSSGSSSFADGAASLPPPWLKVAQILQTGLEGRLHLTSETAEVVHVNFKGKIKKTSLPALAGERSIFSFNTNSNMLQNNLDSWAPAVFDIWSHC